MDDVDRATALRYHHRAISLADAAVVDDFSNGHAIFTYIRSIQRLFSQVGLKEIGAAEALRLFTRAESRIQTLLQLKDSRLWRNIEDEDAEIQVAEALFEGLDPLPMTAVARWLTMSDSRITVLAAIASAEGIATIEKHPRSLDRVRVFAGKVFDDTGVFSDRLQVFPTAEIAAGFRETCRRIGGKLDAQSPLGWGGCAWAIVAEYNVPDCTLPIIWKGDPNLPWKALFPRR